MSEPVPPAHIRFVLDDLETLKKAFRVPTNLELNALPTLKALWQTYHHTKNALAEKEKAWIVAAREVCQSEPGSPDESKKSKP